MELTLDVGAVLAVLKSAPVCIGQRVARAGAEGTVPAQQIQEPSMHVLLKMTGRCCWKLRLKQKKLPHAQRFSCGCSWVENMTGGGQGMMGKGEKERGGDKGAAAGRTLACGDGSEQLRCAARACPHCRGRQVEVEVAE